MALRKHQRKIEDHLRQLLAAAGIRIAANSREILEHIDARKKLGEQIAALVEERSKLTSLLREQCAEVSKLKEHVCEQYELRVANRAGMDYWSERGVALAKTLSKYCELPAETKNG